MSYPRNAASPEPVAIGAVVQISDGAVQTSGCTVRIKPIGVAEADGGGTTAYSTDGIVLYTPTQAETNYTSFVLIAKKTGCIPVSVTVVTSAHNVAGKVDVGAISGDATAADNAEAFFDGTGYAAANNAIADALLKRDVDQVEATAPVDSLCYVILAARYAARSGSTLTVYKTDGVSAFNTRTLGTTGSPVYIVSMS